MTEDLPKHFIEYYEMAFAAASNRDLHKLSKLLKKEKHARYLEREADRARLMGGYRAMANFLAGVTWAMACRVALRASKEHTPVGGKRPQSGEMWLPRELLYAVRHQVKARGWHPITAPNWDNVRLNLAAEQLRESRGVTPDGAFDPARGFDLTPLEVVKFNVRMAAPTYAALTVSSWDMED